MAREKRDEASSRGVTKAPWLIAGRGALGAALGVFLRRAGERVLYFGKDGPWAGRFSFRDDHGTGEFEFSAETRTSAMGAVGLFLAVKAYDLETAIAEHAGKVPDGAPVVCAGNGAIGDIVVSASRKWPTKAWRLGVATVGVTVEGPDAFRLASCRGSVTFGPLMATEGMTEPERRLVAGAGGMFGWSPDVVALTRRKWLFNTVINTLTAVHRLPTNGSLLERLQSLQNVYAEAYRLGVETWGAFGFSASEGLKDLLQLVKDTAENENSMARDVRLGRRTESPFLAGLALSRPGFPLLLELHRAVEGI